MGKTLGLIFLTLAAAAPAAADEVIIGEMEEGCALPFCGG
jgi:hypothetical protein